jgi:hypothetical protein
LAVSRSGSQRKVRWRAGDRSTTAFAVYRVPINRRGNLEPCGLADARYLLGTQRRTTTATQQFTDPSPLAGHRYVVTALDRLWNESRPAVA